MNLFDNIDTITSYIAKQPTSKPTTFRMFDAFKMCQDRGFWVSDFIGQNTQHLPETLAFADGKYTVEKVYLSP